MKKRLNVLCLLVVLVLGYSIFESIYQVSVVMQASYKAGYNAGKNRDMSDLNNIANMKPIALMPDAFPFFTDSILNEKTGEYVPVMHSQMIVSVKTKPNIVQSLAMTFSSFINVFAILTAIVIFILLIVSINKSNIFNWKNVRRLRWLGGALILSFICSVIPMCLTSSMLSDVFSIKGYSLHLSEFISITNLVLGLSALLVAEVFAIGLRMKEEQDLTI